MCFISHETVPVHATGNFAFEKPSGLSVPVGWQNSPSDERAEAAPKPAAELSRRAGPTETPLRIFFTRRRTSEFVNLRENRLTFLWNMAN